MFLSDLEISMLFLTVVLLIVTLLSVYHRSVKNFIFYLTTDIPGPTLWELVTVHAKRLLGDDFLTCLCELSVFYNYQPWGMWVNGHYMVFISDVDSITEVITGKCTPDKPTFVYANMAKYVGDGLLTLNGPIYRRHRKLISPALKRNVVEGHLPRLNAELEEFVKQLEETTEGKTIDIRELVGAQALMSGLRIVLSGPYTLPEFSELATMLKIGSTLVQKVSVNPLCYWLDSSIRKNKEKLKLYLENMKIVFLEAKSVASAIVQEDGQRLNFFELMYQKSEEEGDDRLTEDEYFEEVKIILAGSSETIAGAINACLFCLAWHPEVQERVYEEMISIFGKSGRYADPEDLAQMVYLDQVIKESLRMFPPGPITGRHASEEVILQGCKIPKGSVIAALFFAVNRDPKLYEVPLEFDPNRFSPENCAKRPKLAFIPFSVGVRECPGKVMSDIVLKMFLSYIIRNFEILPGEGLKNFENFKVTMNIYLHLSDMPLRLLKRR